MAAQVQFVTNLLYVWRCRDATEVSAATMQSVTDLNNVQNYSF
jgi:hypothetical protein